MAKSNFDFTSSSWPRMPEAPTRDSNLPGPGEEYTDNFYESLTMSVTSLQPPSSGSYSSSQCKHPVEGFAQTTVH
ncbi:hypothetical protein J1614_009065 [Plenodomus biglobosus]|nr:hypothetical protein J1614_009065 [Plenodomus biglobosus]